MPLEYFGETNNYNFEYGQAPKLVYNGGSEIPNKRSSKITKETMEKEKIEK